MSSESKPPKDNKTPATNWVEEGERVRLWIGGVEDKHAYRLDEDLIRPSLVFVHSELDHGDSHLHGLECASHLCRHVESEGPERRGYVSREKGSDYGLRQGAIA